MQLVIYFCEGKIDEEKLTIEDDKYNDSIATIAEKYRPDEFNL